jgi:alkylation response protein AidB-like acyl-CoA dehydrogenase
MQHRVLDAALASTPEFDVAAALARVLPVVRESRAECERARHVPPPLAEALAKAGLLQMYLPRGLGGKEVPPLVAFHAIEEVSKIDGSAGWCTMIASLMAAFTGWLPPEVGRAMSGQPADLRLAGSIRPQGKARIVEGGYRVDGQWDFASGIHYARWVVCPCVVMDGDQPVRTPTGAPKTRIMWLPAERIAIVDTWDVVGLRGTGSHDFVVKDQFVAESHTSSLADPPRHLGALYVPRLFFVWVWTATVANALGIARGAMDAFVELAKTHSSTSSTALLRDRPLVQARTAEAEAILNAARLYVLNAVGHVWVLVNEGSKDLDAAITQARLAITHAMHEATRAVDIVFHAAGTNAVYAKNPLERYFRDAHVTLQHGAALPQHFESAGKALLGLRPTDPGW